MSVGKPLGILEAVDQANQKQKRVLFERALNYYHERGGLSGRTFAVWGLAFKPRTDDMREAPSLELITALTSAGAHVKAYDPESMEVARALLKDEIETGQVELCERPMGCVEGADALFIVTEWPLFHHPDFDALTSALKSPVIFDGRNIYDPEQLRSLGFTYFGIGRGDSVKAYS